MFIEPNDMTGVLLAVLSLAMGGVLKGATGTGVPIVAVPVMAMFFNVQLAITVFAMPNFLTNIVQAWSYRKEQLPLRFMVQFVGFGGLGAFVGSIMLANLPATALTLLVAVAVFIYVGLRLSHPDWILKYPQAVRFSGAIGLIGGTMFGATGISAPVTLSFLNAMRLERRQFIATITAFFIMMSIVQVPMLFYYGIMDGKRFLISVSAIIPILAFMPLGAWLARFISAEAFDKLILVILTIIAIRLVWQAI